MNEKKNRSLGGVLMFLLKLPFRMAALPLLIALLAVRFLGALITGLSSIVTNAICTLSFAVAAGNRPYVNNRN